MPSVNEPTTNARYSCRHGCWLAEMSMNGVVLLGASGKTRKEALAALQRMQRERCQGQERK